MSHHRQDDAMAGFELGIPVLVSLGSSCLQTIKLDPGSQKSGGVLISLEFHAASMLPSPESRLAAMFRRTSSLFSSPNYSASPRTALADKVLPHSTAGSSSESCGCR